MDMHEQTQGQIPSLAPGGAQPGDELPAAAVAAVRARLGAIALGPAVRHGRMTIFPAFDREDIADEMEAQAASALEYRVLAEAIAAGTVEVREREQAAVPELALDNRGEVPVLILDGEEVVGGRQNRVVNATMLIAAGISFALPVSCVEQGRWHETTETFSSGESTYFALKREKFAQVSASLRRGGKRVADQGAVWGSVGARQAAARVSSPTSAMHALYHAARDRLVDYVAAFAYPSGAVGLVVALGDELAGADLFDRPRTAEALWPKLIRSYALDALDALDLPATTRTAEASGAGPGAGRPSDPAAGGLLERARDADGDVYPAQALGNEVRLAGRGVLAGALVWEGVPVHVALFQQAPDAGMDGPEGSVSGRRALVRNTARRRLSRQEPDAYARLLAACRALPPARQEYRVDDYVTNLLLTVLDFRHHTTTVERARAHYERERRREVRTHADLARLLAAYPDDRGGNTALAVHLWGYRLWTRARLLRGLVAYFDGLGVTDQEGLRAWAERSDYARDFAGRVPGLGYAVYNWLVMRQGVATVKPDVHVRHFVEALAPDRRWTDGEIVEPLTRAARDLGLAAHELDWRIWEAQRARADDGPGSPPAQGR